MGILPSKGFYQDYKNIKERVYYLEINNNISKKFTLKKQYKININLINDEAIIGCLKSYFGHTKWFQFRERYQLRGLFRM